MTAPDVQVYAPLHEFKWSGEKFEVATGLWIRRFDHEPDLRGQDSDLGTQEQKKVSLTRHWLTFPWAEGDAPSVPETVNLVLLALWLAKPTKTHVAFRFLLDDGRGLPHQGSKRLLDRFQWVRGATSDQFEDSDLKSTAVRYPVLRDLCIARGRLNDALILTLAACFANRWQTAIICYAAAAETILTYDKARGLTERLSSSYACLTKTGESSRDKAFHDFAELYAARSNIVHGRSQNVPDARRLLTVARFGDVLRRLWRVVLSSDKRIEALEGTELQRKEFFLGLQAAYSPPGRRRP